MEREQLQGKKGGSFEQGLLEQIAGQSRTPTSVPIRRIEGVIDSFCRDRHPDALYQVTNDNRGEKVYVPG